jgi:hypothetical protein
MRRLLPWLTLVVLASGCHAKFKREAHTLGEARTQVVVTGSPDVQLGMVYDDSLVAGVINVVQEVKSVGPTRRIMEAVDVDKVNYRLQEGIRDGLGKGPPFAYTDKEDAALMNIELERWGLYVPTLGAPGEFVYDLRITIFKKDGDRIYRTRMSCSTGAGSPPAAAMVFGTVNNVKQLEKMSDEQIQEAFDAVAYWCGGQLVSKMRRHAG